MKVWEVIMQVDDELMTVYPEAETKAEAKATAIDWAQDGGYAYIKVIKVR